MALLKRLAVPAVMVLLGLGLTLASAGSLSPDREHRVKAVFLFNFAQFVQWPESAFAGPNDPLVVGILGDDPFDAYLDEVVRGEKVDNRPIEVRRCKGIEDALKCHVLFISRSGIPRLEYVLARLRERHVLTVGESSTFFRSGGMVSFSTEEGRIRLKINLDAVHKADLNMSSKLLRLADVAQSRKE